MRIRVCLLSLVMLSGCSATTSQKKPDKKMVSQGTSCADIKSTMPKSNDGYYVIDLDSQGPLDPISVFCEMSFQGGGWTLFAHHSDGVKKLKLSNAVSKTKFGVLRKKHWLALRESMQVGMMFVDEGERVSMISAAKLNGGSCESISDLNNLADFSKDGSRHLWHHENRGCDGRGLDYSLISLNDKTYKSYTTAGAALYQSSAMKFDVWPYGSNGSSYKSQDTLMYFIK